MNCSSRVSSKLDRPSGLERGQRQNVLDEHFLLAAETAADAFAEHPDLVRREIENIGQRAPRQERHLRAGADVEDAVRIDPGEAAMGFQGGVLDALGGEGAFIGHRGAGKRGCDIAEFAVAFSDDIALRVGDAVLGGLVGMDHRRAGRDGLLRGSNTAGRIS